METSSQCFRSSTTPAKISSALRARSSVITSGGRNRATFE